MADNELLKLCKNLPKIFKEINENAENNKNDFLEAWVIIKDFIF